MPKLAIHVEKAVHLPNKGKYEGKMLFFSERYQFALIEVESTIEVKPPHDGSRPQYNEKVSILARDKNLSSTLRGGTIKWDEQGFFLFVKCKFCPYGLGGPVINHAGELVAMSCVYNEDLPIISITTIRACITMWTKSGCIARPMLGMAFGTVKLLDIVRQDILGYKYKIYDGFIVDEVAYKCNAEKLGIRQGNVIRFSDVDPCYLPEIEVNDLVGKAKRTIILPLEITCGSEY